MFAYRSTVTLTILQTSPLRSYLLHLPIARCTAYLWQVHAVTIVHSVPAHPLFTSEAFQQDPAVNSSIPVSQPKPPHSFHRLEPRRSNGSVPETLTSSAAVTPLLYEEDKLTCLGGERRASPLEYALPGTMAEFPVSVQSVIRPEFSCNYLFW